MIVRRATATPPRTLEARIAKLEAYRPVTEEKQALVAELMELMKKPGGADRMMRIFTKANLMERLGGRGDG
jgi:hypothetical protein